MSQHSKLASPPSSLFGDDMLDDEVPMFGSEASAATSLNNRPRNIPQSQESGVSETLRIEGFDLVTNYHAPAGVEANSHEHSLFVSDNSIQTDPSSEDQADWGADDNAQQLTLLADSRSPGAQLRQERDDFVRRNRGKGLNPQSQSSITIPTGSLVHPISEFEPFAPPATPVSEMDALKAFAQRLYNDKDGFIEYTLDDFSVYCDMKGKYSSELRSLHLVESSKISMKLYFDGVLTNGHQRFYVKRVPIKVLPIGNYLDLSVQSVHGQIWIGTKESEARNAYYKLRNPSWEYERFFTPFLWIANLAKHVVDFLNFKKEDTTKVSIHHFRTEFSSWLRMMHGNAPAFVAWRQQYPRDDFRIAISSNIGFLYKECFGILGDQSAHYHLLWSEVLDFNRYKAIPPKDPRNRTVVTEYIHGCFSHMPFGTLLKAHKFNTEAKKIHKDITDELGMEVSRVCHDAPKDIEKEVSKAHVSDIRVGDTISTLRDSGHDTKWKREESFGSVDTDRWFARVERIKTSKAGERSFDVTWYYRPVDTMCALMRYPWNNELFFSTHCSCKESIKITEAQILGVHEVDFWGDSTTTREFFCRQTYIHEERKWVSLKQRDMECHHKKARWERKKYVPDPEFEVGDTILIRLSDDDQRCEPCVVLDVLKYKTGEVSYHVRKLIRRNEGHDTGKCSASNEVLYSERKVTVSDSEVVGRCGVRFILPNTVIPIPFNRNGTGCLFYITHRLIDGVAGEQLMPLDGIPETLKQYQGVADVGIQKLRGLDLFCGGGNFGRGLEDGGAVEMRWIVDHDSAAAHTYMANCERAKEVQPFVGSIDDFNRSAMTALSSKGIPEIGSVDFIARGSPCPGFSGLTNDTTTVQQRKNQSLVAAFASCVDIYRPKFGVLENVAKMIQTKDSRAEDVFSQLICALVGMGYQTRLFFLDACSCGTSQIRSRIFIVFAAPGYVLPSKPRQSHAYPGGTKSLRLGRLATGEAMAEREVASVSSFEPNTAGALIEDLPKLGDAKPDICVPFPDHRCPIGITQALADLIALIPTRPLGMNFVKAYYGTDGQPGVLSEDEKAMFLGNSKSKFRIMKTSQAFGRVHPNGLIQTLATTIKPRDAKTGKVLHWDEDRTLSILEAKRAQGFRDEDVLLGEPANQLKIVGNSVAREPAIAIGLCIQEAYIESQLRMKMAQKVHEQRSRKDKVDVTSTVESTAPGSSVKRQRRE